MNKLILSLIVLQGSMILASQPTDNSNNDLSANELITRLFTELGTRELYTGDITNTLTLIKQQSGQRPESLRDENGNNLLHAAFLNGNPAEENVFYLINETQIDINGQNNAGQTPLDIVVMNNPETNNRAPFKRLREAGLRTAVELRDEEELVDDEHEEHSYLTMRNGIIATLLAVGGTALYKYVTNNKEKSNA